VNIPAKIPAKSPAAPRAIYCIGRNYGAHARELGNAIPASPVVFLKSPSAVRGLAEAGKIAYPDETFHHEVELVLRIGQGSAENAGEPGTFLMDRIDAVALGLDLTRREVQTRLKKEGLPWTDAKSFTGSAVLSSFAELPASVTGQARMDQIAGSRFTLWVNGERRQHGTPRDMIFDLETVLRCIQSSHGLFPGDIIFTGTPEGVGPLRVGDKIRVQLATGPDAKPEIAIDESGTL